MIESKSVEMTVEKRPISGKSVRIGVVGTNFKISPIAVRERLAKHLTLDRLTHSRLDQSQGGPSEITLLSTCNRIEIYYASEKPSETSELIRSLFSSGSGEKVDTALYEFADDDAVKHLFQVSSGLDSLVIGEAQILAQVREASSAATEKALCGPLLAKLFSKSYDVGREIRETHPKFTNGFRNSVSRSVSDLICSKFVNNDKTKKPNLLLIGSGKMIRLATASLDRSQIGRVVVASRRMALSEVQADNIVPISEIARVILFDDIDVILTATSSQNYILNPSDIEPFVEKNKKRSELLILDISVPRNVNPKISGMFPNVTLLNLDDLKDKMSQNEKLARESSAELLEIEQSMAVRKDEFMSWMRENSEITPLLAAVRRKAEEIRSEELENALARLPGLTQEQTQIISKMSERIIRRFLHDPASNLRGLVRGEEEKSKQYSSLLRELFFTDSSTKLQDGENHPAE